MAEEEEKATRRQEATTTMKKNGDGVDQESIPSPSISALPPPSSSSCSSSLVPNQRVRVRGVPATVRYVGPVANKDPADTWIGLEWDNDGSSDGRGKHDGSVGGVRYFQTRGRKKGPRPSAAAAASTALLPAPTGSLVRAAALDAPGVLVVGCSVEEALVRRYRGCRDVDNECGNGDAAAAPSSSSPAPLPPSSSSSSSSFVAGHEEVAARLARIHELEVASVAGSPAAFCLEDGAGGGDRGGKGADDAPGAATVSPLLAPLRELAPRLRALDAAGCLFSEWREIERILAALPGLERLDLTRCGGLAAAAAEEVAVVVEEEEEEEGGDDKSSPSSSSSSLPPPPPPPRPRPGPGPGPLPKSPPLRGLRELVLAETGTEWGTVLSALAGSGVTGLRALSLRRCGLRCLGGGGEDGEEGKESDGDDSGGDDGGEKEQAPLSRALQTCVSPRSTVPRLASCAETSTSSSGSAWTATKGGSVAVLVAKTRRGGRGGGRGGGGEEVASPPVSLFLSAPPPTPSLPLPLLLPLSSLPLPPPLSSLPLPLPLLLLSLPPPPRRSSAIGLGSARASSSGSHASQGSPPQSLQSVPRSHLTSRVGEESREEPEGRKDEVSRGKRNLPSSQRPSLAEGHESSQMRTRTRGWAHGGKGWRLEGEEAARRDAAGEK